MDCCNARDGVYLQGRKTVSSSLFDQEFTATAFTHPSSVCQQTASLDAWSSTPSSATRTDTSPITPEPTAESIIPSSCAEPKAKTIGTGVLVGSTVGGIAAVIALNMAAWFFLLRRGKEESSLLQASPLSRAPVALNASQILEVPTNGSRVPELDQAFAARRELEAWHCAEI